VLAVLEAAMPPDPVSEAKFVRQVLLDHNFRADGAIVAEREGRVVGFCLAIARQVPLENAADDSDRGYITLMGVLPQHQREGVGTAMLAGAEDFLRAQGRKLAMISPYAPGYFICGVDVRSYAGGLQFFLKQGYKEVYRPIAMEVPLWDWHIPAWVQEKQATLTEAGVTVEPYRAELTLPVLDFAAREFAGDWVRVYRQTIDRIMLGDRPDRIIVAHERCRVIGFSHYENERFGPIGVASAERGRGLGHVLTYRTLEAQRLAGLRTAWFLWSDDQTAARLYNAVGFREVRRFAVLRKQLNA
jgi:GNAT superfamily N-acetyltransferase